MDEQENVKRVISSLAKILGEQAEINADLQASTQALISVLSVDDRRRFDSEYQPLRTEFDKKNEKTFLIVRRIVELLRPELIDR